MMSTLPSGRVQSEGIQRAEGMLATTVYWLGVLLLKTRTRCRPSVSLAVELVAVVLTLVPPTTSTVSSKSWVLAEPNVLSGTASRVKLLAVKSYQAASWGCSSAVASVIKPLGLYRKPKHSAEYLPGSASGKQSEHRP